ncbi:MAG: hypothetical protein ACRDHG_05395 [Anaerolineales bacterium]
MNRETVGKITRTVVEQFPELDGVRPAVRRQEPPGDSPPQFLLTYKGAARLPNGKSMQRVVRVVADEAGHVIRISTSR